MASRRSKLIASTSTLMVGVAGYFVYSVLAVQGTGTLAQAPLNNQAQIPPAFIMAVDDSNSMTFERLFSGGDGRMQWNSSNGSFFKNDGTFFDVGDPCGSVDCYVYLFPHDGYNSSYSPGVAIPPIAEFGFARSPAYNAGYFNPAVTYSPWKNADGTLWPAANPAATRADPRTGGTFARANAVIYDLTDANGRRVNADTGFSVLSGMTIPAGTVYRTPSTSTVCGSSSSTRLPGTNRSWSTLASDRTVNQNCSLQISYFPAVYFLPAAAAAPVGFRTADINRPVISDACGPGCDLRRYEIKSANYFTSADYTRERQNFANWMQYHHNRILAMVGGMTESLSDVNNMRVGYFTINNRVPVTMRTMPVDRPALYTSITSLQAGLLALGSGGGTPNRDAVAYLGEQFRRTDAGAPIALTCQKNGGMLFTDGYSNSGTGPTTYGNVDGALGPPFADSYADTIADMASRYYESSAQGGLAPLRTGGAFIAGKVPVPDACSVSPLDKRLDCQANLHMNFYGVTLGAKGAIYDVNTAATADPYTTVPNWNASGDPRASNGGPTVDEIWHATLNARGDFINAKTPADITDAMRRVLASVTGGASPAGTIALTGSRVGTGSLTVSPFYEARNQGTDWYSRLTAQTVSSAPITGVVSYTDVWEASARLPAAAVRNNIWFGSSTGVLNFNSANIGSLTNLCNNPQPGMSRCTSATIAALGGGTTLDQAVAYLKGDQTLEAERFPTGKLRFRSTRLGDIVNSSPVVSGPKDDYGYRSLPAPYGTAYATYLTTGKNNRRPMVYAGANDGMLHAFDGRIDTSGGVERFAYIPQGVVGHLGNLLFPYKAADGNDQKFQHRYYVDGPLTVSDAYYGGGWKTSLVGTMGAGARGVFALDVSTASDLSGSFSASDRLWDINDLNTSLSATVRANIGHVLGRPVIVPVKTGSGSGPVTWRAVFGNGYNSTSGKAVLFMVNMGTGAPTITMIEAVEVGAPAGSNGLGNLVVTDRWGPATDGTLTARFRDGFADTVYAADQKGAIWKFDLRSATPANLTTPLFTTLLYTSGPETGTRQPILGGLTATAGPAGGVMVYFGTGSFSFDGDGLDTTLQSLYAILDNNSGSTIARSSLLRQTVGTTTAGVRMTSSNAPTSTFTGWYLDLPAGERFVGYPRIESGIVFMPTYFPNATTGCGTDGNNWLYGLNALTGGAGLSRARRGSPTGATSGAGAGAVALNTGGTAPVKDVAVLTTPRIASATPAELDAALAAQCSMVVQVAGAPPLYLPRACGRQSWRQIQ